MKNFTPLTISRRSTGGYSLVELLVVVAMIAAITFMSMGMYGKFKRRSEKVSCIKNIAGLGTALYTAMNTRDAGYPNPPGNLDDDDSKEGDQQYDEWWFDALKPYGIDSPEQMVCPSVMGEFRKMQQEQGVKVWSSYVITPFDEGKLMPLKYNTPWVSDKYPHEGDYNVYRPNGGVMAFRFPSTVTP